MISTVRPTIIPAIDDPRQYLDNLAQDGIAGPNTFAKAGVNTYPMKYGAISGCGYA